jgi:hypothetical protein
MPVANTILAVAAILDLVVSATEALTEFQTLVGRAQAEGRDITDEELATFIEGRQKAAARLQATP